MKLSGLSVVGVFALWGCAGDREPTQSAGGGGKADDPTVAFEELRDYLYVHDEPAAKRFDRAVKRLENDFDNVCGDTFCEGEFSNIRTIDFRCSLELATKTIGRCTWVFGGSNTRVDPATGKLVIAAKTSKCGFAVDTEVDALLGLLDKDGDEAAIDRLLPGTQVSIYDSIIGCM